MIRIISVGFKREIFEKMKYYKYIEQSKNIIKKITVRRWIAIIFMALLIIGAGIYFAKPQKKLLDMRNSQRRSDVVNILNAVYKYSSEYGGDLSAVISGEPIAICRTDATSCENLVDLSVVIEREKETLAEIPVDPSEKGMNSSGYQISKSKNGRINVTAPLAENGAVISRSK